MPLKDLIHIKGLDRLESIKSISGVSLDEMDVIYEETRYTLGRANVGIHNLNKIPGTELFIDTILGYQIGHYDGRHPERLDVSLDLILYMIKEKIYHSDLIKDNFHQSKIGINYMATVSKGNDMLPIRVYEKINHVYDQSISDAGGNLDRLKNIKRVNNMLKRIGVL